MCGIAGVFGKDVGIAPSIIQGVQEMTLAQAHRGPDDEGWLQQQDLVLGHRRLSIVDLSPMGRQPMSNENETVWVAYNGEIYNYKELRVELARLGHRFCSSSDTEILVHVLEQCGGDVRQAVHSLSNIFADS